MKKNAIFLLTALMLVVLLNLPLFAQKGLYLGAGFGSAATDGDIGEQYDGSGGVHFMLGFKATEKLAFELEFGAYEQKIKNENPLISESAFANFSFNTKYFLGASEQRTFRPYVSGGIGFNAFGWDYTDAGKAALGYDGDAVGSLSLMPGLGFELMLGRIAALNVNGRYAFNSWAEETSENVKLTGDDDFSGNTFLLNLGLILHL
jgi:hypothetical protein